MNNEISIEPLPVSNRLSLEISGRMYVLTRDEAEDLATELRRAAAKLQYEDPDENLATFGENESLSNQEDNAQ